MSSETNLKTQFLQTRTEKDFQNYMESRRSKKTTTEKISLEDPDWEAKVSSAINNQIQA